MSRHITKYYYDSHIFYKKDNVIASCPFLHWNYDNKVENIILILNHLRLL